MSIEARTNDARPRFRFRLIHVLYTMAVIGASLATCGLGGLFIAAWAVAFWFSVHWGRRSSQATSEMGRQSASFSLTELLVVIAVIAVLVALLLPAVSSARSAAHMATCQGRLKQIVVALHHYHDHYGCFPPAYVADENGKPMHSWRVLLLPYLEQQTLYNQYRFDEPWNGPRNRKLLSQNPEVYQCHDHQRRASDVTTSYFAVVGPDGAWPGGKGRTLDDFADGTGAAILVLEGPPHQVRWMEPRDLSVDEAMQLLTDPPTVADGGHASEEAFFTTTILGRNAVMADGSLRRIPPHVPHAIAAALLHIADGKPGAGEAFVGDYATRANWPNIFRFCVLMLLILLPAPWAFRPFRGTGRFSRRRFG